MLEWTACFRNQKRNKHTETRERKPFLLRSLHSVLLTKLNVSPAGKELVLQHRATKGDLLRDDEFLAGPGL